MCGKKRKNSLNASLLYGVYSCHPFLCNPTHCVVALPARCTTFLQLHCRLYGLLFVPGTDNSYLACVEFMTQLWNVCNMQTFQSGIFTAEIDKLGFSFTGLNSKASCVLESGSYGKL